MSQELQKVIDLIHGTIDSTTCVLYLPVDVAVPAAKSASDRSAYTQQILQISNYCSEQKIDAKNVIKVGSGMLGWVSKSNKSSLIADYQHNGKALGYYLNDKKIKSICAVPVRMPEDGSAGHSFGVLCIDSEQENYFTDGTREYLESCSEICSSIITLQRQQSAGHELVLQDQEEFSTNIHLLLKSIGSKSVDVVRIELKNFSELEKASGFNQALVTFQKIRRLISQSLPGSTPVMHTEQGETIIALDNMVTKFYLNKIRIIISQLSPADVALDYSFAQFHLRDSRQINAENLFSNLVEKTEKNTAVLKSFKSMINR